MHDEARVIDLINADLDGTLSGPDRAELARLLLQDPEVRQLHEDFRLTDDLLRRVPQVQPPRGLRDTVLQSLRPSGRVVRRSPGEAGSAWYRYAAAVAGGLLVVGMGYGLLHERESTQGLQGSVAGGAPLLPVPRGQLPGAETRLDGAGLAGSARLTRTEGGVRLDVEIDGETTGELVATFDATRLTAPEAAAAGGFATTDASTPGRLVLPITAGRHSHGLEFAAAPGMPATVRLEVRSAGELLRQAELTVPASR